MRLDCEMRKISIAAVTKLKHAALHLAAEKLGGQSALARHLGLRPSEVGRWCNLAACPSTKWSEEKQREIEKKLLELTGKTFDELFPIELREAQQFLRAPKKITQVREMEVSGLLEYARRTSERLCLPAPEEIAERTELRERFRKVLTTLSFREREIIKLRYGIGDDGRCYTLKEAGHIVKVHPERIRQIEAKAIRKLQQPSRSQQLVEFLS